MASTHGRDQAARNHFSIDAESLRKAPWTNGMIYILPRDSFEEWEEWTSKSPVRPLAKLAVSPVDFPFLKRIQGFDWRLWGPLSQDFPFLGQVRIFPIGCHLAGFPGLRHSR